MFDVARKTLNVFEENSLRIMREIENLLVERTLECGRQHTWKKGDEKFMCNKDYGIFNIFLKGIKF